MSLWMSVLDGLIALGLIGLGWRASHDRDAIKASLYFLAMGTLMALAWLRLEAPDLALAEAAIGAGIMGALFLASLARGDGRSHD